jgi:hypothetical protein
MELFFVASPAESSSDPRGLDGLGEVDYPSTPIFTLRHALVYHTSSSLVYSCSVECDINTLHSLSE